MNVRKILADWLSTHGYDGLYLERGECGCLCSGLVPSCERDIADCKPGYKGPGHEEGCGWAIYESKADAQAAGEEK